MRVDVSGRIFNFPHKCACCYATADSSLTISATRSWGKKVVHRESKSWDVPYCSRCVQHLRSVRAAGQFASILSFFSIILGILVGFGTNIYLGIGVAISSLMVTVFVFARQLKNARAECGLDCVRAEAAIAYLGWSGTLHQFEISSPHFARDFMAANQKKLVNLSSESVALMSSGGSELRTSVSRSPRRYIK
jgi:hypothetical protein